MSNTLVETEHTAPVTDVAADTSGRHLATASLDGTVRIYEAVQDDGGKTSPSHKGGQATVKWRHVSTLRCSDEVVAESRGVSAVAWAPLAFYTAALVTCTNGSNEVAVWSDVGSDHQFKKVYSFNTESPGCSVAWAPQEYGKLFAVGCADGVVVVFTGGPDGTWDIHAFESHSSGSLSLSFAPFFPPGALLMAPLESEIGNDPRNARPMPIAPPRMVTCSGGRTVKLWTHSFAAAAPPEGGRVPASIWTAIELQTPESATAASFCVVSWAPNMGLPFTYIAAGAKDGSVAVWMQDGPASNPWRCCLLPCSKPSPEKYVTKLSWSLVGTFLLVSHGDGYVEMWKEVADPVGTWQIVSELSSPLP